MTEETAKRGGLGGGTLLFSEDRCTLRPRNFGVRAKSVAAAAGGNGEFFPS